MNNKNDQKDDSKTKQQQWQQYTYYTRPIVHLNNNRRNNEEGEKQIHRMRFVNFCRSSYIYRERAPSSSFSKTIHFMIDFCSFATAAAAAENEMHKWNITVILCHLLKINSNLRLCFYIRIYTVHVYTYV